MNTPLFPSTDVFNEVLQKIIPCKPVDDIEQLITHFLQCAQPVPTHQALTFNPYTPQIYLLTEGVVHLHRQSDHLLLSSIYARHVIGLAELLHPVGKTYLRREPECKISAVSRETVLSILNESPVLWSSVSRLLAYHLHFSSLRDLHLINHHAYDAVRGKLIELMSAPIAIRRRLSALRYIQERTTLSRSMILKLLSELRMGGYIEMKRGCLTSISILPLHY
ncbi:helix-turn-helix domain-containing protein [Pseudomonas chlororaphis]|uniref:helix-turn-helix domain-containing protein n=1 Tax=Pseudomonas chlororaphis TaxID=587753 RepID=UPI000BE2A31A|nr:helix-turn-helix domain-containing protein [Pseudomonas chlororaphis]